MDREYRPYYMPYPIYDRRNDVYEERRDIEYMKRMYPGEMRRIQGIIEDECDKMEYNGSMMYDEYPDRVRINMLANHIYNRGGFEENTENDSNKNLIKDIITVMLFNEMYKRRCRKRKRKYFY